MGLTTHSIHCRAEGRPPEEALEALEAALRRRFAARGLVEAAGPEDAARALFLVPGQGQWIAVFDTDFEESETVAAFLSRDVGLPAVTVAVLDSDRFGLKLFRNGKPAARVSAPAGRAKAPAIARAWLEVAPDGASSVDLPFEISGAPRLPLRAVAGSEKLARDLADPAVLVALASLGADREAAAPAVRAAIDGWLDLVPGEWRVNVQRGPLDFDFKTLRINSAGRMKSGKWKDALEAAASCHLLWGAIDPDPRTGIGRAAFVLDASRPAFSAAGGVSPQLCFWTEIATAPAGATAGLRGLLKELVRRGRPLQAFLARWNWKPLSLGATPYETACGIGGAGALTAAWCGRYLRGVGEELWLGAPLTGHLDRATLETVSEVSEGEGGWWVTPRGPVPADAFEKALAPVVAGREEWQGAVRR